jgi:hypothetical protein
MNLPETVVFCVMVAALFRLIVWLMESHRISSPLGYTLIVTLSVGVSTLVAYWFVRARIQKRSPADRPPSTIEKEE